MLLNPIILPDCSGDFNVWLAALPYIYRSSLKLTEYFSECTVPYDLKDFNNPGRLTGSGNVTYHAQRLHRLVPYECPHDRLTIT